MNNKMTEEEARQIVFYCKDCGEVVGTEKVGRKYVYKCKKCGTKNVAFGTKKSIFSFFHVKEGEETSEKKVHVKGDDTVKVREESEGNKK